jgi:BlaI family transcriptional regulator, penicillinase repressor
VISEAARTCAEGSASPTNVPGTEKQARSVVELASLELACMNALWELGEATVRDIRERIAPKRPRAYTTIMTIMDRLARKRVVERRKAGRAFRYVPRLDVEEARRHAVRQVVESFFGGSVDALVSHLKADRTRRDGGKLDGLQGARSARLDETVL